MHVLPCPKVEEVTPQAQKGGTSPPALGGETPQPTKCDFSGAKPDTSAEEQQQFVASKRRQKTLAMLARDHIRQLRDERHWLTEKWLDDYAHRAITG